MLRGASPHPSPLPEGEGAGGFRLRRWLSTAGKAALTPLSRKAGEGLGWGGSVEGQVLFAGHVAKLADQVVDDFLPDKLGGGAVGFGANLLALLGMLLDVGEVADDLVGILSLQRHGVLEGDGVVFACRAGEGDAARRHHLQPDQPEWLVAAIGQRGVGGGVAHANELLWDEEAQVVDVSLARIAHQLDALARSGALGLDIDDAQAK